MQVAVVGGGVVGLSTAIRVLETFPGAKVCLWTHKAAEALTSHGPPGLFRPHAFPVREKVRRWAATSFRRLSAIYASTEVAEAGIAMIQGALLSDDYQDLLNARDLYGSIVNGFRKLSKEERSLYSAIDYAHGWAYSAFVTPGRSYVPYLRRRYAALGGRVWEAELSSLAEIPARYDVIFNCAGLGAAKLAGTDDLVPVRGLLLRLNAPWQKHFAMVDGKTAYAVPSQDSIFVGGCREAGETSLHMEPEARQAILDKVYAHWPALKKAPILDEWVGLRPWRKEGPRVESETLHGRFVIHNYGHGGNGFVLSWGTAEDAVDLLKERFARAKL